MEASTPRAAIKEAFKAGIIKDGDGWIKMLEDRKNTSHTYDENLAKEIYEKIKKYHVVLLEQLIKMVNI